MDVKMSENPFERKRFEMLPPKWDVFEVGMYYTVARVDKKYGEVEKLCVMYVGETEGRTLWFRTRETAQAIADALNEVW